MDGDDANDGTDHVTHRANGLKISSVMASLSVDKMHLTPKHFINLPIKPHTPPSSHKKKARQKLRFADEDFSSNEPARDEKNHVAVLDSEL